MTQITNTGLPILPETKDTKKFEEMAIVYNAIEILGEQLNSASSEISAMNAALVAAQVGVPETEWSTAGTSKLKVQDYFTMTCIASVAIADRAIVSIRGNTAAYPSASRIGFCGIALNAAVAGQEVRVCTYGKVSGFSNRTPGAAFSLSDGSTLGYNLSTTEVWFSPIYRF